MKKIRDRFFCVILSALVFSVFTVPVCATDKFELAMPANAVEKYEATTLDEAKDYLESIVSDDSLSIVEKRKFVAENVAPDILEEYLEISVNDAITEAMDKANKMMEEGVLAGSGESSFTVTVTKDDGISVAVTLSDNEEDSSVINSPFEHSAKAAAASEVTKNFGDRYFTTDITVIYMLEMTGRLISENHYTISATGLQERYMTSSSKNIGTTKTTLLSDGISKSSCGKSKGNYISGYANYQLKYTVNRQTYTAKYKLTTKITVVEFYSDSAKVNQSYSI